MLQFYFGWEALEKNFLQLRYKTYPTNEKKGEEEEEEEEEKEKMEKEKKVEE